MNREMLRSHIVAIARDLLGEIQALKAKRKGWQGVRSLSKRAGFTEQDLQPLLTKVTKHAAVMARDVDNAQTADVLKRFEDALMKVAKMKFAKETGAAA